MFCELCSTMLYICVFLMMVNLKVYLTINFWSSFADTKEGRYNPKMNPVIPVHNWRKGSQVQVQYDGLIASWVSVQHWKGNLIICLLFSAVWLLCRSSYSFLLLFLIAVGCFDQEACWGCSERQYSLSYVSTALQGNFSLHCYLTIAWINVAVTAFLVIPVT